MGLFENVVDFGFGEVADLATHVKTCRPLEKSIEFLGRNGCVTVVAYRR